MKKVLIFDDDKEILLLCKTILERHNIEVVTLIRCDNIISEIETHQPDIVLMDLWIPEMGGEKAIAVAKADEKSKKIPILVFSANNDIQVISKKVKADGFLRKPFKITELLEIVNRDYIVED